MVAVRMNAYLVMNGNAREAIDFYAKALDAQVITVNTFGEQPPDPNFTMPDEVKDLIMHGLLKVGETDLMLSDTYPGMPYQTGNHITIALISDNADRSRRFFDALAEGGEVGMPLQETFWSPAYGQVTDRFGVSWQITTEVNR